MRALLRVPCGCHPSTVGACTAAVLGRAASPANTPLSPGSLRESLQPGVAPGAPEKLSSNADQAQSCSLPARAWLRVSYLPAGSACSFMAKTAQLGRLPKLGQLVRALAAAQVLCATASLCLSSLAREGARSVVPGCGGVKLASLEGLAPISDSLVACRGGGTCRRKGGFVADVKCNVLLGRKGYFEILQITNFSASRGVQPAVGAALASCRAWLCVDPAGKGARAPFAFSPPSAEAPAALRSAFLLANSFQMRLKEFELGLLVSGPKQLKPLIGPAAFQQA